MLINMAAEENINVNNLVQTIVQHSAFRERINLTATDQEQSTSIVLIASAGIAECEESISSFSLLLWLKPGVRGEHLVTYISHTC